MPSKAIQNNRNRLPCINAPFLPEGLQQLLDELLALDEEGGIFEEIEIRIIAIR